MQSHRHYPLPLLTGIFALGAAAALLLWFISAPNVNVVAPLAATVAVSKKQAVSPAVVDASAESPSLASSGSGAGMRSSGVPADQAVGTILAGNPTVEAARAKLLEAFPTLSDAEKIAAAPHLVNLVEDDGIVGLVSVLHDPRTPTEAKEIVFDNMFNRPPQIGWPVLLGVMAVPGHPLAQKARETMSIIVGSDYEDHMEEWKKALEVQLTRQKR